MRTRHLIRRTSGTIVDDVVFTIVLSIFAVSVVALSALVLTDEFGFANAAANPHGQPQRVGAINGDQMNGAAGGAPRG